MAKIPTKIDWKCSNWFQIFHNVWKYENNVYPKYNLSGRNKPIKMVQNISKLTPKLNFWKRWKFSKSLKIDLKFIHMAKITINCSKWRQKCKFWKPWISKKSLRDWSLEMCRVVPDSHFRRGKNPRPPLNRQERSSPP